VLFLGRESPLTADERPPDRDALGGWIARTIQPALAYAISLVRNRHDAEDIVQECYRRLLARSDYYNLPRDGQKLLYKSITNACINLVQRRPVSAGSEALKDVAHSAVSEDGRLPESRLIQQETERAIEQALAELPVNQRAVLELSSLGHSLLEAAEMVNVSHANARVLLHRARQSVAGRLKKYLEGKPGD